LSAFGGFSPAASAAGGLTAYLAETAKKATSQKTEDRKSRNLTSEMLNQRKFLHTKKLCALGVLSGEKYGLGLL
jgi:hypothetical protein